MSTSPAQKNNLFFCQGRPIQKPEDVIPGLAKGEKDWKKGRSAYELAHSWMDAAGIPTTVRQVLDKCDSYKNAALIEAHFEKTTPLRTDGRPSQTDLLAFMEASCGRVVVGVEGKVDESFDKLVEKWNDGSPGKRRRLEHLCEVLEIPLNSTPLLRYQLFHRTAAALFEAERYGVSEALMLVHSFSTKDASFSDFAAFSEVMGAPVVAPDEISPKVERLGISLRLGWVRDWPLP